MTHERQDVVQTAPGSQEAFPVRLKVGAAPGRLELEPPECDPLENRNVAP